MRAKRIMNTLLGLLILLALVAVTHWVFATWFGTGLFDWYLKNGAVIGVATAAVAMVWGSMREHRELISSNPWDYIGSYLQLVGLPIFVFGTHMRSNKEPDNRASTFDMLVTIVLVTALCALLLAWFLVVVPLQYFVYLVCGAPGRLMRSSQLQVYAKFNLTNLELKTLNRSDPVPESWWNASIADKPVAVTGLFSSLIFLALKSVLL